MNIPQDKDPNFPWGDPNPEGGYKVGDIVGIIHSDHDSYMFDNPTGVVTQVVDDEEWDEGSQLVRVSVEVDLRPGTLYLIERPEKTV